jgi:hypothetical protein
MKSFLKEIESKFVELENNYCDACDRPVDQCICDEEDIAEISTSAAAGSYNTPMAFSKMGAGDDTVEVLGMKRIKKRFKESVNTPPSFKWKETGHQTPESNEELATDKFAFSSESEYGTSNTTDETKKHSSKVAEAMDRKYEQLIESYRTFATGDSKSTPEQKVKNTIKEVAKKLQEIETLVNHTSRLKTESGLSRTNIGSSADKALVKIAERLTKISERVRSLGE